MHVTIPPSMTFRAISWTSAYYGIYVFLSVILSLFHCPRDSIQSDSWMETRRNPEITNQRAHCSIRNLLTIDFISTSLSKSDLFKDILREMKKLKQQIILFVSPSEHAFERPSNICNLYMNRFAIEEEAGCEILNIYQQDLSARQSLAKKMLRLVRRTPKGKGLITEKKSIS